MPLKPGDAPLKKMTEQMIRVDHAGEFGAARIYDGQLAIMGDRHAFSAEIREMKAQEQKHLDKFDNLINERRVRPTALQPFWNVAGFALGAATALMGPKAAMACTAAVEDVIDEHYGEQAEALGDQDPELKDTIEEFRADEAEHRQTALDHGAEEMPGYSLLSGAIKVGCRAAIWASKRV